MRRLHLTIVCLFLLSGTERLRSQGSRDLIFAARRTGVAEVIDAETLETVARLHFDFHVERLAASADGLRLEVAGYETGKPCCQNYTLEPTTGKLEKTLRASEREYFGACFVSPDGRWCVQLKSFRGPALKMVDLRGAETARILTPAGLPEENSEGNWSAVGAWSGDRYYFYVQRPNDPGFLWTVSPGDAALGAGTEVARFGEMPGCRARLPVSRGIVAAAGHLFLYEPFGSKADRTGGCRSAVPGGAWMLDPETGSFTAQVASLFQFNRLISDTSGATLYGVAVEQANWDGAVQVVALDGRDGTVLRTRRFAPGVLQISAGRLAKVPAGDMQAHP